MKIISIVGRDGTIAVCHSDTKKADISKHNNTVTGLLDSIKKSLEAIKASGDEQEIRILVPDVVGGVGFPHVVNHWRATGCSMKGTKLSKEYIISAVEIQKLLTELPNTKIYFGSRLRRVSYQYNYRSAWECLNKITGKKKTNNITARIVSGSTNF